MRGFYLSTLLLICACQTAKKIPETEQAIGLHAKPLKIFGIGKWDNEHIILTLTDANGRYFVITAPLDTMLKIGNVYNP